MKVRTGLGMLSLLALAACGSNNGSGDNSTNSGVTSQATPNAVCSEQAGVCGPRSASTAPLNGLTPTTTPSPSPSSTKAPKPCHHRHHRHHHTCATPSAAPAY